MNAYEQGFIEKCAEYGVDPLELLKSADDMADVTRDAAQGVFQGGLTGAAFGGAGLGLGHILKSEPEKLTDLGKSVAAKLTGKPLKTVAIPAAVLAAISGLGNVATG